MYSFPLTPMNESAPKPSETFHEINWRDAAELLFRPQAPSGRRPDENLRYVRIKDLPDHCDTFPSPETVVRKVNSAVDGVRTTLLEAIVREATKQGYVVDDEGMLSSGSQAWSMD